MRGYHRISCGIDSSGLIAAAGFSSFAGPCRAANAIMPDHEAELGLTSCPKHCFGRALAKSDAVVVGEVAEMDEATIIGD